ncbi:MAG: hypothetical protein M9949_14325 [Candidatus Kapabacteria bacterium]|nr:hypothetical protein [Candidatus Kapabacteria bacterium]
MHPYESKTSEPIREISEYNKIALDMGKAICNFTPEQQNEMLQIIHKIVRDYRNAQIEEVEKHLAYLKGTFNDLGY